MIPHFSRAVGSVQQEHRIRPGVLQNIEFFQELELVTGDKVCRADQVLRTNRARAETQV